MSKNRNDEKKRGVSEEIGRLKGLCNPDVSVEEKESAVEEWKSGCVGETGQPVSYVSSRSGLYGIWPGPLRKGYTLLAWVRVGGGERKKAKAVLWSFTHSQGQLSCSMNYEEQVLQLEVSWNNQVTPTPHACRARLSTEEHMMSGPASGSGSESKEWMLVGFHHNLPYLKRPSMTVHVNGWELGKCELAYPFSDTGDIKMEGFADTDVAALALFHQGIPGPIQSMAFEHGICPEIIPSHMPHASITTHKDALISNTHSHSHSHSTSASASTSSKTATRHIGIPTTVGVLLSSMGDMTGDLLCTRLAQTSIGFLQIPPTSKPNSDQLLKIHIHMGPTLVGDLSTTPKLGLVSPTSHRHSSSSSAPDLLDRFVYVPDGHIQTQTHAYSVPQLLAIQPMHFFLLAFYRALPPPPHLQSKTWSKYKLQMDHLTARNYNLAHNILLTVARLLNFHGTIRDDMLQQGQLHILWNTTLQLLNNHNNNSNNPNNTDATITSNNHPHAYNNNNNNNNEWYTSIQLPDMLLKGWEQIVLAACGQIRDKTDKIPPPLHIRRTCDVALTVGIMTLDHMWHIIEPLYFHKNLEYGWLWRPQISVDYILTLLQQSTTSISKTHQHQVQDSATSIVVALLEYSLSSSKHASKGQDDVSACVAALTKSPSLGNVVSHVVIKSLHTLLQKGNALRSTQHPREIVPTSNTTTNHNQNKNATPTTAESSMVQKLFRNLSTSQFHDVVAPMILSRSINTNTTPTITTTQTTTATIADNNNDDLWKQHWWWILQIFIALICRLGAEGEFAAKSTGTLLLASARAGSLERIFLEDKMDWFSLILPPYQSKMDGYITNMSIRLKMVLHLLPGLILVLPDPELVLNLICTVIKRLYGVKTPPSSNKLLVLQVCKDATPPLVLIASLLPPDKNKTRSQILGSASNLIWQAMAVGGGEASTSLWRMAQRHSPSKDILSQLVNAVLQTILNSGNNWNNPMICAATARLMDMVEETKLYNTNETLISTIVQVLQSGRTISGWSSFASNNNNNNSNSPSDLATIRNTSPNLLDTNNQSSSSFSTPSELYQRYRTNSNNEQTNSTNNSTTPILLPVLQPCLRILLKTVFSSPSTSTSVNEVWVKELQHSLTAAMGGLYWEAARDVCLEALYRASVSSNPPHSFFLALVKELYIRNQCETEELNEESRAVEEVLFFGTSSTTHYYDGLSETLQKCENVTNTLTDVIALYTATLSFLQPYLQQWKEQQEQEDDEELELFLPEENSMPNSSETVAAEAMASFIELKESVDDKFVGRSADWNRQVAFAQTSCWKWSLYYFSDEDEWERGMPDGSRDYGSRLVTHPTPPHFSRSDDRTTTNSALDVSHQTPTVLDNDTTTEDYAALVRQSSIQILDITKLSLNEDESESNNGVNSNDDDDDDDGGNSLGFPEKIEDTETSTNANTTNSNIDTSALNESCQIYFDESMVESSRSPSPEKPSVSTNNNNNNNDNTAPNRTTASINNHDNKLFSMSSYSHPPDGACNLQYTSVDMYFENVLHVKPEGSRRGTLFVTSTHLIMEYESSGLMEGEDLSRNQNKPCMDEKDEEEEKERVQQLLKTAALRPRVIRWNVSELSHVYLRRYRLRDSALELFFIPSGGGSVGATGLSSSGCTSVFLDMGKENRDVAANAIMKKAPSQTVKQWPEKSGQFLHEQLRQLTMGWVKGRVCNLDYLLSLNCLAGRSYNDLCQYPVMPWVLSNYSSEEIPDLTDRSNFRDLSKPMGALNEQRLEEFLERFHTFQDPSIPPFMYGSHYSTSAGVVLHFLVRLHPFAQLHRQLQSGHFDVADRLFSSVPRTWDMCTGCSAAEVKELTPEWYMNPNFLRNTNEFELGTMQEGEKLGDVILPPWAKNSPEVFIEVMRKALESEICSQMLPSWIDLIFGRKQQGPDAVEANNVFFYLTYYGSVNVSAIPDEALRIATELQIAHFGQCPMQLFYRHHVPKFSSTSIRRKFSLHDHWMAGRYPFQHAPSSYSIPLEAPPPGPHAPLTSIRLAGSDRCVALDSQGIFHFFRWAWKVEEAHQQQQQEKQQKIEEDPLDLFSDKGYFIAQRELPHFRTVPRLPHVNPSTTTTGAAFSRTMFASRSKLLVLSDGDGEGGLSVQLVDPIKCRIQGELLIPQVHSDAISCIAMDAIGTASGMGGVGGELAVIGSKDGTASVWRFISSQYLPMRPRWRIHAHLGQPIIAANISTALNISVTVSSHKCVLFHLATGMVIRILTPPSQNHQFGNAVCLSQQGFLIIPCIDTAQNTISLHLYSLEGVSLGSSEVLEQVPSKIYSVSQGRAVVVCSNGGISIRVVSALEPLKCLDLWAFVGNCYDVDTHSVVAAAACSSGTLRLHALKGISDWSRDVKQTKTMDVVGNALAKPAQKLKSVASKVSERFFGSYGKH